MATIRSYKNGCNMPLVYIIFMGIPGIFMLFTSSGDIAAILFGLFCTLLGFVGVSNLREYYIRYTNILNDLRKIEKTRTLTREEEATKHIVSELLGVCYYCYKLTTYVQ